ncbi:FAD-binding domain-containing protein (plasmid) [Pseudoalteromonas sp. T1lg65]|uniref:FAD-binding domain-containing protein n=1 Tax=Pseudoalteromonas sp. T1lg65 TaxID=2077101 RepID=UPI003F78C79D
MINVVWLKRDFRLEDHLPIFEATASAYPTLFVYIIEPQYWQLADTSARQFGFIRESLLGLAKLLAERGASLTIRKGNIIDVFEKIHNYIAIDTLFCHQETGNPWTYQRDSQVFAWCKTKSIKIKEFQQQAVFRGRLNRDDWQTQADAFLSAPITKIPSKLNSFLVNHSGLSLLDEYPGNDTNYARNPQHGGYLNATRTLSSFLNARIERYLYGISSPVTAQQACSRLSPYLCYGLLSLRQVLQQTLEQVPHSRNRSGFLSRLYWHSHFVQKLESEPCYAERSVHRSLIEMRANDFCELKFQRWAKGETGVPFVDACMRMLIDTGWINFRMRAMLMAYASYHLWLDWPKTAAHLASLFIDYEPGIHYPQVQMQAGTTGINPFRIYNPVVQGKKYDPEGHFIRHYIPELAHVPDGYIHTPWLFSGIKEDLYTLPELDPDQAAKAAKQKIAEYYKSHIDSQETQRVISKHASRKRKSKRKPSPKDKHDPMQNQLSLL